MDWAQAALTIGVSVVANAIVLGHQLMAFRVSLENRLTKVETKVDSLIGEGR